MPDRAEEMGATATGQTAAARRSWWPLLGAIGYGVAIFASGLYLHPVVMFGNEADDYVGIARDLLDGRWRYDVFHPLLYPVLTAGFGSLLGDFFVAGKLVSAAAAGLLFWCVHRLAAAVGSAGTAWLATALVAVHPYIVANAFQATDNLLSTALATAAVLACLRLVEQPGRRRAITVGLLVGTAYWSRYSTMALAVTVAAALLLQSASTWRSRVAQAAWCAGALVVVLLPHFLLSYAQFGRPLHDENWRNLALRHVYDLDWNRLFDMPFRGWLDVISHDPGRIASNAVTSLGHLFGWSLPGHLTGRPAAAVGWPEWGMYALAAGALAAACLRRDARLLIVTSFPLAYLSAVVITFFEWPRQIVIGLPPLLVVASVAVLPIEGFRRHRPRLGAVAQTMFWCLVVAYVARPTVASLASMREQQPIAEVAAVRRLAAEHGPETTIYLGTMAWAFEVHADFEPRQGVFPGEHLDQFWRGLQSMALLGDPPRSTRFFVLSPRLLDSSETYRKLVTSPLPAPLSVVECTEQLMVLEARFDDPGLPVVRLEPSPFHGGSVHVSACVPRPPSGLTHLDLKVQLPDGSLQTVPLAASEGGSTSLRFELPAPPRGRWTVTPRAVTRDGPIEGKPLTWTVE